MKTNQDLFIEIIRQLTDEELKQLQAYVNHIKDGGKMSPEEFDNWYTQNNK